MNIDKETEEKKLRDLTPEKDAKGGLSAPDEVADRPINPGINQGPKPIFQNVKGATKGSL